MNICLILSGLRNKALRLVGVSSLAVLIRKLALFLLLGMSALSSYAQQAPLAWCDEDWAPTTFSMPASITVPRDAPVGTLLGPAVTNPYSFHCWHVGGGNFPGWGTVYIQFRTINPGIWSVRSGGGIITPTNVPGVGLLVNDWTNITQTMGNDLATATGLASFGGNVTYQFIKTGPITPGVVASMPNLWRFLWVILFYNNSSEFSNKNIWFGLNGGTVINQSGCAVTAGSVNLNVNLPTVSPTKFTGVGTTTGDTPFNLALSCSSGSTVKITMQTTSSTTAGVIQPTVGAGFATGVGVQVLDQTKTPVSFSTKTTIGATPDGILSIPYTARYYQTGPSVTAGKVAATVTYTMAYE